MWEMDYKESWAPKNWCFWTVVLKKTFESPLDCKEIQLVHPRGNQSWVFIGRTDAEAEIPILWPPDAKNRLIKKDPGAGKDWRQEEKRMTEWGCWVASPTQWTGVWGNLGSVWWTGRPGVLQSMGSQIVGNDWVTELNWTEVTQLVSLCSLKKHMNCPSHFVSIQAAAVSFSSQLIQLSQSKSLAGDPGVVKEWGQAFIPSSSPCC